MEVWSTPSYKAIMAARWIDNKSILAGYAQPGEMLVFSLGIPDPTARYALPQLADCWIKDFDISKTKQFAYCSTHSVARMVFKMSFILTNNPVMWRHQKHKDSINTVRLSPDQSYVLSGENNKTLVLTNATTGSVLNIYDTLSEAVKGIIWFHESRRVLICTFKELVLLKVQGKKENFLKKRTEFKHYMLGLECIHGINIFWINESGNDEKQSPFLVYGGRPGRMYRLDMCWNQD
jgi:WD40 repeat protein